MRIHLELKKNDADGLGGETLIELGCKRISPTVFEAQPRFDRIHHDPAADYVDALLQIGVVPVETRKVSPVGYSNFVGAAAEAPSPEEVARASLEALRDSWSLGGDMGKPDGWLVRQGGTTYAVKLELWSDDGLMDLPTQDANAARKAGTALARAWKKDSWPATGYLPLDGAEGFYGATWAVDEATDAEVQGVDEDAVVEIAGAAEEETLTARFFATVDQMTDLLAQAKAAAKATEGLRAEALLSEVQGLLDSVSAEGLLNEVLADESQVSRYEDAEAMRDVPRED